MALYRVATFVMFFLMKFSKEISEGPHAREDVDDKSQ